MTFSHFDILTFKVKQRPDKHAGKSGKKKPRPGDLRNFSLLPVHEATTEQEREEIEVTVASNLISSADQTVSLCNDACIIDTIESVVRKGMDEVAQMEKSLRLVLNDTEDEIPDQPDSGR